MTDELFRASVARVEQELWRYQSAYGAQVVVVHGGERVLCLAKGHDGTGRPLTSASIFRVYCTLKPCLAVLIARLCDDGLVELDEPLERLLGPLPVLDGGVTLRHLLTHTAGLSRPMAFEMELIPPHERRAVVEGMTRPGDYQLGVDAAYSEYAAWQLAGWAIARATGEPLRNKFQRWLDDLGMHETWIGMTEREFRTQRQRIGVNHDHRGSRPLPMGLEPGRRWCTEVNPAHGGYTTMRDIARFYSLLLTQLEGAEHPHLPCAATLARFCSLARPPVYDPVLGRVRPFGLGFMVSLTDHAFGDAVSTTAFGHSGYAGASFAMADPVHDLVVAATFNGIVDHNQAFQRRTDLLRAIHRDLAIWARA